MLWTKVGTGITAKQFNKLDSIGAVGKMCTNNIDKRPNNRICIHITSYVSNVAS